MHEDRIIQLIPEITWEGLIREIVRKEGMNPWDIDLILLTNKFMKEVKERDLVTSGKFILVASMLLRMKAEYMKEEYEYYLSELAGAIDLREVFELPELKLVPKLTPPRKRKVTLDELIFALRRAMRVSERREERRKEREKIRAIRRMFKSIDLEAKIRELYDRIKEFFGRKKKIHFFEIAPSKEREDIIWTFLPLLHLASQGRIELEQERPFGDIYVKEAS